MLETGRNEIVPMYEYECRACKARFEHLVFDRTAQVVCPKCGSSEVAQQLSRFAVGSETAKAAPASGGCDGCPGMQGGSCPMNQ
jgi:putative FmdB family regulatory protein